MGSGVFHALSKPALFAWLRCVHRKGEHFLSLSLKEESKESVQPPYGKCPRPLFLIRLCDGRGPGLWLALSRGFFTWLLMNRSQVRTTRWHKGAEGPPFMPCPLAVCSQRWCGVWGNVFCVKCLVSYEGSTSELKYPFAFIFFFLYKEREPKSPCRGLFCDYG